MKKNANVLTTGEIAKICSVASRTVAKWIDSGKLKGYKVPLSNDRRVLRADLEAFLKEHGFPYEAASGAPAEGSGSTSTSAAETTDAPTKG